MPNPHNTKHVRKVIRSYGIPPDQIWNNKYTFQKTVKCYVRDSITLARLARRLYHDGYVSQYTFSEHKRRPGLIVRINPLLENTLTY